MNFLKKFLREEDGMETIEVVVIVGVLLAIALIFKDAIGSFAQRLINTVFDDGIIDKQNPTNQNFNN